MLKYTVFLVFTLVFTFGQNDMLFGQIWKTKKKTEHLSVKYEMTGEGQAAMMNGSIMTMIFSGSSAKTSLNMMNGMMRMDMIFNREAKEGIMFLDMMGQKKYAKMDKATLEAQEKKHVNRKPTEVKYLNEYKKIAGYKCKKVIVTVPEMKEPITMYVTKKLKQAGNANMPVDISTLEGFPLAWEVNVQGIKIQMKAIDVNTDKPAKETFDMTIKEGYEEMDMKEMGQFGGSFGL